MCVEKASIGQLDAINTVLENFVKPGEDPIKLTCVLIKPDPVTTVATPMRRPAADVPLEVRVFG